MTIEDGHATKAPEFPFIEAHSTTPELAYAVRTSDQGVLFHDIEGVSFTIGEPILDSVERVNSITRWRTNSGDVVCIDLGPPPLRFRTTDLGIPHERVEELRSGLRFAGIPHRVLRGNFEPD